MSKRMILIILLLIGLSYAQPAGPQKPAPNWWLKSSLIDSTQSMQFHADLAASYNKTFGAFSSENQTLQTTFIQRKFRYTNHMIYHLTKMDNDLNGIRMKRKTQFFTDYLVVDLSMAVSGQFGFMWERDDALFLKNRYTWYAGIGMNKTFWSKLTLDNLIALGRINQEYFIPVDAFDVVKKPYIAVFFRENYSYLINPKIAISGQIFYFGNLDQMSRYRWGNQISLNMTMMKYVMLVVGYNYTYDSEMKLLGIDPENGSQNIGVQFSF